MTLIRLTLAIFLFAGVASAGSSYERVDTADILNRADAYQGRLVEITGDICAVNADGKSIRLFDKQKRVMIDVSLNQFRKSERSALTLAVVKHVSVYGRAESKNGKLVIEAHQVHVGE